jgi:hypothetical protein
MRKWALLGAAFLTAAAAAAEDPLAKPGAAEAAAVDPVLQRKIDRSIAAGVAWLLSIQEKSGEFPGPHRPPDPTIRNTSNVSHLGQTALALYTLRSCGVSPREPQVPKAFDWLRAAYHKRRKEPRGLDNYGVALTLLALEAHHHPPPPHPRDADRWGRSVRPSPAIPGADQAWIRELTGWLVEAQVPEGGFGYDSPGGTYEDHSNTQYALLGLKAARRCGFAVPDEVWRKALRHLLQAQERNGPEVARGEPVGPAGADGASAPRAGARDRARGWGYQDRDPATGSMTTGGVSSIAICRAELAGRPGFGPADDARAEQAMLDGLAWLGSRFTVTENPAPPGAPMAAKSWHSYYLYGLERAGVLAEVVRIGGRDWYAEGSELLVGRQRESGAWGADTGDPTSRAHGFLRDQAMLDTCFALLFLKRATARLGRGVATDEEGEIAYAATLDDREFGALFDRVFGRFAAAAAARREALSRDFVRLGTRSIPRLVARLGDRDPLARSAALDALRATTGESLGFDPEGAEAERAGAIARWEAWWRERGERLDPDPEAGRFVERPR